MSSSRNVAFGGLRQLGPHSDIPVYRDLGSPHADTSHRASIQDIYSMTTSLANIAGQQDRNRNANDDQALAHADLGISGNEHSGLTRPRGAAPIPLGCDPDRDRSIGVRHSGYQWRQMSTNRLGCHAHRRPRRQLRYLSAELVSPVQQIHFWSALRRWRIGLAWMLAQGEASAS
jgi:hypothetical protein